MLKPKRRIRMTRKKRSTKADATKNRQLMLVVSLPKANGDGEKMKNALKSIADEQSRSVSNLVALILKEHLTGLGKM
jgi:hypothetical protein